MVARTFSATWFQPRPAPKPVPCVPIPSALRHGLNGGVFLRLQRDAARRRDGRILDPGQDLSGIVARENTLVGRDEVDADGEGNSRPAASGRDTSRHADRRQILIVDALDGEVIAKRCGRTTCRTEQTSLGLRRKLIEADRGADPLTTGRIGCTATDGDDLRFVARTQQCIRGNNGNAIDQCLRGIDQAVDRYRSGEGIRLTGIHVGADRRGEACDGACTGGLQRKLVSGAVRSSRAHGQPFAPLGASVLAMKARVSAVN